MLTSVFGRFTLRSMKGSTQRGIADDTRVTVSIRNVSQARWKAVQEIAERQDRKLKGILDEMMNDFLKKHGYVMSGDAGKSSPSSGR
jgi:hypothetical protein